MPLISRRALLSGCVAPLLGAAAAAPAPGTAPRSPPREPGLNARALRKDLFYGAALDTRILRTDRTYMAQVPVECGFVVGEYSFKWSELRPEPDKYAFDHAELLVGYAARHGLRVRGHALVWYQSNPDWLEPMLKPDTGEKLLATHIRTTVGHFRKRVVHWDVVNEAIEPEDGKPNGLRDTLWLRALGPSYIDTAFHSCAMADPHALRVLNDYGMEYALPWQERRRGVMLDLLASLKARNVPIQALGLQAHLDGSETHLDQKLVSKFCADVASLGLKIVITEMDVRDNGLPADIAVRDAAIAAHARAYLDAVLPCPAVLGVVTWGLSDRRSWLDDQMPRADKLPQRPLPLDTEMHRKPLWTALAGALDLAPVRRGS
ncbi:MAG: endo-1,4-beta-xylanase [Acidisphaera sp.]|nr:endo-1,4-beta-xylanase [Acidisphaera sp.]